MNLKNFGNNAAACRSLLECRGLLIAPTTPATAVAASPTVTSARVASARVARTAGVIGAGGMAGCGMVSADPAKLASAVAASIIAAVRSSAVARPPPMTPAVLDSRHQQIDQRRTADRDYDCRQRVVQGLLVHGFLPFPRGTAVRRKKPRNDLYLSPNMATSFIDHSSEIWNFPCDRPLYPLSCSIRKVMP
jgi:hypothetical protein